MDEEESCAGPVLNWISIQSILHDYMCHGCGQLYGSAAGFPVILVGPELQVCARGPQDPI